MNRRVLMVLLSFGVLFGYGSAFAHLHHRTPCHGWGGEGLTERGWPDPHFGRKDSVEKAPASAASAPVAAQTPQVVYVQAPPASIPAAPPAPQVIYVQGPPAAAPAPTAPQVIYVQVPAPAPQAVIAPPPVPSATAAPAP